MSDDTFKKELVFLVLQCLEEESLDLNQTVHRLEQESGIYFNMKYFEDQVMNGAWVEVEKYLSGFTKLDDNGYSNKIYFEIRKHKYLEALDRQDKATAVELLVNDLKVFEKSNEDLYKQLTMLITLSNYRENKLLSKYGDTRATRTMLMVDLTRLIKANPVFENKLTFPAIPSGRLRTLINKSVNWQHQLCKTPRQNPEIKTLTTDHVCLPPNLNNGLVSQPVSVPALPLHPPALLPPAPAPVFTVPVRSPMDNYNISHIPSPPPNIARALSAVMNHNNNDGSPYVLSSSLFASAPSNQLGAYGFTVPQQITEPSQCVIVTLPDRINVPATKIGKLLYTYGGDGVVAILTSGKHKFWKWDRNTAIALAIPQLSEMETDVSMRNDALVVNMDTAIPCLAISRNDAYVLSACGGNITLFNLISCREIMTIKIPPPVATFVAFHPQDNNIMAFGMEDSNIHVYHVGLDEMGLQLKGHQKHVTGITFSSMLSLMVSSGADAQLVFWSLDTWEKKNYLFLELPGRMDPLRSGDTRVQFHTDQIHFLVSHETQLAIYLGSTMNRLLQWVPQGELGSSSIMLATYSCDGSLIYAAFRDASIAIFNSSNLRMKCRIAPNVYISRSLSNGNVESGGVSIGGLAAHPYHPYQFAIGLSDGSVKVIEPKPGHREWGEFQTANRDKLPNAVGPINID